MQKKEKRNYEYWTDKVAKEVEERVKKNSILKKIVKERGYVVYDEKTPSGKIHIGSGRGWVIHDMIVKTMREHGMKAKFILSSDDMDPFDSIPADLSKEKFEKFLGIPIRNIPSPQAGYKSYADYFFSQCTELFDEWGIEADLESTGERYIKGDFNWAIKKVLDNAKKIQEIFKKVYGKNVASEKLPFNPICEKCGKIGTTVATEWDPKREVVKYSCEPNFVEWARGCGHKGEISPYNGNGKLPWKVEWAAKWPTIGVVVESAGKDHFTKGGSRTIAIVIASEIFDYPPPWPSTSDEIGQGYEFFLVEGKKMSTSKGVGVSFAEISKLVPPEILRFLMVKTRPEATIDFKEENIPLIYDDFDRHERIYFGKEKVDEHDEMNAKRVYELSVIGGIPKKYFSQVPFSVMLEIAKILPEQNHLEFAIKKLTESGHIRGKLSADEKKQIEHRLNSAKQWLQNFVKSEVEKIKFNEEQKAAMKQLIEIIEQSKDGDELQRKIFEISTEKMPAPEFFRTAYQILLKANKGPRLGPYIFERGKEEVIRKLKSIL